MVRSPEFWGIKRDFEGPMVIACVVGLITTFTGMAIFFLFCRSNDHRISEFFPRKFGSSMSQRDVWDTTVVQRVIFGILGPIGPLLEVLAPFYVLQHSLWAGNVTDSNPTQLGICVDFFYC